MKLLKWFLIAVGGVVILFAGVLAFIVATFDPNQYKGQIADLVKEKTQRTLTIEGDIKLSLYPTLGVQLGKTRLSEFRSDQEFAGLEQMRVSLALLPLLSKQVVVDEVQLVGLHANLVKYKDGKTNFDDLLGGGEKRKEPKPAAVPEPVQPAAPIRFDVEGIRLSNAAVSWRDEAAGTEYKVSNIEIKTGRVAEKVPVKFELGAAFSASEPKLDVILQSAGTLTADVQNQTYVLAVLSAAVKAIGPRLDAKVDLKLSDLQVSPAMLRIGDVLVSVDAKQADNAVKGRLSTPVTANLDTQLFQLPKLAGEFDITSPSLPMKTLKVPLAGTVSADLKQQTVNADLTTRLDESNIKAKFALSQFDAQFTRFDVAIDKLNLDRYLPPQEPKTAAKSGAPATAGRAGAADRFLADQEPEPCRQPAHRRLRRVEHQSAERARGREGGGRQARRQSAVGGPLPGQRQGLGVGQREQQPDRGEAEPGRHPDRPACCAMPRARTCWKGAATSCST